MPAQNLCLPQQSLGGSPGGAGIAVNHRPGPFTRAFCCNHPVRRGCSRGRRTPSGRRGHRPTTRRCTCSAPSASDAMRTNRERATPELYGKAVQPVRRSLLGHGAEAYLPGAADNASGLGRGASVLQGDRLQVRGLRFLPAPDAVDGVGTAGSCHGAFLPRASIRGHCTARPPPWQPRRWRRASRSQIRSPECPAVFASPFPTGRIRQLQSRPNGVLRCYGAWVYG